MTLQAALVLIPAGIALYSGVYHLFIHSKTSVKSAGNLPFALICITIAFYDIFCAGVYSSSSPEQAVIWQRNQMIALSLIGCFVIWFVSDFVKRRSRKLDAFFIFAFAVQTLVYLIDRSDITFTSEPLIKEVVLFGQKLAVYREMQPGIAAAFHALLGICAIFYIFSSLLRYILRRPDSSSAMLIGFLVISIAIINDSLVANGAYRFFYLTEYSFVILAISMAYALACRQVELESSIVASEKRLRETVDSVPDIIYSLDSDGLFLSINDSASKLLGYSPEHIIGRHFIDFVHPDDKPLVRDTFEKTVTAKGQKPHNMRLRLCNFDGEPIWISANSRMIYDYSGNFLREQGVMRDIRMMREYEQELQTLAAAVNQADESIIITDRRGVIEYVNPFFERMTGYSREEIIGKNTSVLKSGKHNEAFYQELWSTLRSGNTWRGRFTNRKKDGTLFDEVAVISPVMTDDGRINHYVAVKRDITQEAALESQLRESQKMEAIGRLAGGIAHDFTNALVIILNSAQMVKKRINEDEKDIHELIDNVITASEKTSSLTSQLLAFSHSHQISPRVMNLNKVIAGIDAMIQRMMGSRTNLIIKPSKKPIFVKIDPSQIEQVLIHLAVNANDAMTEGGNLTITTKPVRFTKEESVQIRRSAKSGEPVFGDMAEISVTDSGCGMSLDIQAHVFEPFFTTKGRTKSTGLGLSTVYAIAQKHGGSVDVYSNPGYGTTFRVYLPLAESPDIKTDPGNLKGGKEHIMVVEDNMVFRKALVDQLKSLGYSIFEVDEAKTAISSFEKKSNQIDLVITDLIMPDQNGNEVAEKIRAIRKDTKILFASAYPAEHLMETDLLNPGDTLISKPFVISEVAEAVHKALNARATDQR